MVKISLRFFQYIVLLLIVAFSGYSEEVSPPNGWSYVDSLSALDGAYINTRISQKDATNCIKLEYAMIPDSVTTGFKAS